jgi:hypothetical protein
VGYTYFLTAAPASPMLPTPGEFGALVSDLVREGIVDTPMALLVGDLVSVDEGTDSEMAFVSAIPTRAFACEMAERLTGHRDHFLGCGKRHGIGCGKGEPAAAPDSGALPMHVRWSERVHADGWYYGEDPVECCRSLPWLGARDVAVQFPGLNVDHHEFGCDPYHADVAIFALREAHLSPYVPWLAGVCASGELGGAVMDGRILPQEVRDTGTEWHETIPRDWLPRYPIRWFLSLAAHKGSNFLHAAIHGVLAHHFGPNYFVGCILM